MAAKTPIMAPLSRSGSAKFASKSAGMHPGMNSMPRTGKAASSLGTKYPAPSLKTNAHDAHPVMTLAGQAQKKRPGAKKTFPLNMKAKTPVYKAHKPAANIKSANGGQVFNYETGKQNVGNPVTPKKLVSANMKGSAFYGQ